MSGVLSLPLSPPSKPDHTDKDITVIVFTTYSCQSRQRKWRPPAPSLYSGYNVTEAMTGGTEIELLQWRKLSNDKEKF